MRSMSGRSAGCLPNLALNVGSVDHSCLCWLFVTEVHDSSRLKPAD
jgi:hypothetical protein